MSFSCGSALSQATEIIKVLLGAGEAGEETDEECQGAPCIILLSLQKQGCTTEYYV